MSTASDFTPTIAKPASRRRAQGMTRRTKWILAGIGGVILAALAWHFIAPLFSGGKKAPPPPPVHVVEAKTADVILYQRTIATVVSPATVQVDAQVAGKLLAAYFQEGQLVKKGDPLFLIDPAPFQNALAQAQAQLAKDQAAAQNALNDQQRYTALYAQNATSQQQRDLAIATAKADVAQVNADQATVNIAAENLSYTKITSPIDGKTGPITIQPGNLITVAGATPLVIITQIKPIKLSFFVPQTQLTQLQNQMAAGKLTASVPMAGAPNGRERAPVDFISNIVQANTGTIELRATFANDDQRLVPGQSVNTAITMGELPQAIVVSRDGVNVGPDSSYVYVVGKDMKVVQKTVKVLNDNGTNDAISGDVKPGDQIIVEGQNRVLPGATVAIQKGNVTPPSSPTADADMPT